MSSVVVRYRARGSSETWREIRLSLNADETVADRISRFEDENFGTIEVVPAEPVVQLVHPRKDPH